MTAQGVSERRALALVHMSASSLRYTPAPDTNAALRARIVTLAHRHRRYGAGMIYLKLRQAGTRVNHKRVERLYTEARSLRRRRCGGVKWVVGPCCASLCRSDFGGRPTRELLGEGRSR